MNILEAITGGSELGQNLSRAGAQLAVFGAVALAGLGVGKVVFGNDAGEVRLHMATANVPAVVDHNFRMGSWNMAVNAAGRVGDIAEILENKDLDALALQEVEPEGIEALEAGLPAWNITSDPVKPKPEVLHPNLANLLITPQKPKNIQTQDIEGTSFSESVQGVVTSVTTNAPNLNVSYGEAAKAIQENRTIMAETIKVQDGDELRDIRIFTTHISSSKATHKAQLGEVMKFMAKNTKDQPSVICGDFNASPGEMTTEFSLKRFIVAPNESQSTTRAGRIIDHCAYFVGNIRRIARIKVLKNYLTDHHPIIFNWKLGEPTEPLSSAVLASVTDKPEQP